MKKPREERDQWQRGGARRTRETPSHRCWACDHREEILSSTDWIWKWAREDPYLGCAYAKRMAKRVGP